ncbi:mucin-19-like isoform X2 [Haliotis asinina]|uniref:mucin-19-like isoform X2 n=1 Tax=Haliotis asinina TaxID=109174 RepID=UPI0035320CDD
MMTWQLWVFIFVTLGSVSIVSPQSITTTTSTPRPVITTPMPPIIMPELCTGCIIDNGIGYNPYPEDCSKYVQCFREGRRFRALVRPCPFGQYWDTKAISCRPSELVSCYRDPCNNRPDNTVHNYNGNGCRAYWMCKGGNSVPSCCPQGTRYLTNVGCVQDPTCNEKCPPDPPSGSSSSTCSLKTHPDRKNYIQTIPGVGDIVRPCAPGTVFSQKLCNCIMAAQSGNKTSGVCKPSVHYKFNQGVIDHSGNNVQAGVTNVKLTGKGQAIFDGKSKINIWRFAGIDYGSKLVINMKYRLAHPGMPPRTGGIAAQGQSHRTLWYLVSEVGDILRSGKGDIPAKIIQDIRKGILSGSLARQIITGGAATTKAVWQILLLNGQVVTSGDGLITPEILRRIGRFNSNTGLRIVWFVYGTNGTVLRSGNGDVPKAIYQLLSRGELSGTLVKQIAEISGMNANWQILSPTGQTLKSGKGQITKDIIIQFTDNGQKHVWFVYGHDGSVLRTGTGVVPQDVLRAIKQGEMKGVIIRYTLTGTSTTPSSSSTWHLLSSDGKILESGSGVLTKDKITQLSGTRSFIWYVLDLNGSVMKSGYDVVPEHILAGLRTGSIKGTLTKQMVTNSGALGQWKLIGKDGQVTNSGYGRIPMNLLQMVSGHGGFSMPGSNILTGQVGGTQGVTRGGHSGSWSSSSTSWRQGGTMGGMQTDQHGGTMSGTISGSWTRGSQTENQQGQMMGGVTGGQQGGVMGGTMTGWDTQGMRGTSGGMDSGIYRDGSSMSGTVVNVDQQSAGTFMTSHQRGPEVGGTKTTTTTPKWTERTTMRPLVQDIKPVTFGMQPDMTGQFGFPGGMPVGGLGGSKVNLPSIQAVNRGMPDETFQTGSVITDYGTGTQDFQVPFDQGPQYGGTNFQMPGKTFGGPMQPTVDQPVPVDGRTMTAGPWDQGPIDPDGRRYVPVDPNQGFSFGGMEGTPVQSGQDYNQWAVPQTERTTPKPTTATTRATTAPSNVGMGNMPVLPSGVPETRRTVTGEIQDALFGSISGGPTVSKTDTASTGTGISGAWSMSGTSMDQTANVGTGDSMTGDSFFDGFSGPVSESSWIMSAGETPAATGGTEWYTMKSDGTILQSGTGAVPQTSQLSPIAWVVRKTMGSGGVPFKWSVHRPDGTLFESGNGNVPNDIVARITKASLVRVSVPVQGQPSSPQTSSMWYILGSDGSIIKSGTGEIPVDVISGVTARTISGTIISHSDIGGNTRWKIIRSGGKETSGMGEMPPSALEDLYNDIMTRQGVTVMRGTANTRRMWQISKPDGSVQTGYGSIPQSMVSGTMDWTVTRSDGSVQKGSGPIPDDILNGNHNVNITGTIRRPVAGGVLMGGNVGGGVGDAILGMGAGAGSVLGGKVVVTQEGSGAPSSADGWSVSSRWTLKLPDGSIKTGSGSIPADLIQKVSMDSGSQAHWSITKPDGSVQSGTGAIPTNILQGPTSGQVIASSSKWSLIGPDGTVQTGTGEVPPHLLQAAGGTSQWQMNGPDGKVYSGTGEMPESLKQMMNAMTGGGGGLATGSAAAAGTGGGTGSVSGTVSGTWKSSSMSSNTGTQGLPVMGETWTFGTSETSGSGASGTVGGQGIAGGLNVPVKVDKTYIGPLQYDLVPIRGHVITRRSLRRLRRQVRPNPHQALVTNCNGRDGEGPSIMILAGRKRVVFSLKTERTARAVLMSLPARPGFNNIKLIYDGSHIKGVVNGKQKVMPLSGNIERRQAGIMLGSCEGYPSFSGEIEEFSMYQCLP